MNIHNIITAINNTLNSEKFFVLHRSVCPHIKFKVYKNFDYNLYLINGANKDLQCSFTYTLKAPEEDLNNTWEQCDIMFVSDLIKWLDSNKLKYV